MLYYLDTETTGLRAREGARVVDLALLRDDGEVVVNSLVDPQCPIPTVATRIHGITDAMVRGAPALPVVLLQVQQALRPLDTVIIYNAEFDLQWVSAALHNRQVLVQCAMLRFARFFGDYNSYYGDYTYQPLWKAAAAAAFSLPPNMADHRALADCLATQAVWHYLDKHLLYAAGKMAGLFVDRALASGHPYTTASLLQLSPHSPLALITVENATDRAHRYLSSTEVAVWRDGLSSLVGRQPTESEVAHYSLGCMARADPLRPCPEACDTPTILPGK